MMGNSRSIPDLVFGNEEGRNLMRNSRVLEDEDCGGSDHRIVVLEVMGEKGEGKSTPFLTVWNRWKLKEKR